MSLSDKKKRSLTYHKLLEACPPFDNTLSPRDWDYPKVSDWSLREQYILLLNCQAPSNIFCTTLEQQDELLSLRYRYPLDRRNTIFEQWVYSYLLLFTSKPLLKIPFSIQLREFLHAPQLLDPTILQGLLEEFDLDAEEDHITPQVVSTLVLYWMEFLNAFATKKLPSPPHFRGQNFHRVVRTTNHLGEFFWLLFYQKLPEHPYGYAAQISEFRRTFRQFSSALARAKLDTLREEAPLAIHAGHVWNQFVPLATLMYYPE